MRPAAIENLLLDEPPTWSRNIASTPKATLSLIVAQRWSTPKLYRGRFPLPSRQRGEPSAQGGRQRVALKLRDMKIAAGFRSRTCPLGKRVQVNQYYLRRFHAAMHIAHIVVLCSGTCSCLDCCLCTIDRRQLESLRSSVRVLPLILLDSSSSSGGAGRLSC